MKQTYSDTLGVPQSRKELLTGQYFQLLDRHLADLVSGEKIVMLEISDIAKILCVSHKHFIALVQEATGHHPCYFYIQKILQQANALLRETNWPVSEIARRLTYDPSNFNKFYKKYCGMTPGQYRLLLARETEKFTIPY